MTLRFLERSILSICIVALCVFDGTPIRIHAQAKDDTSVSKQFVGMWKLQSWTEGQT